MKENIKFDPSCVFVESLIKEGLLYEWTTFKQIETFFLGKGKKVSQRDFAHKKDRINELFYEKKYPYFVAHNTNKGYKITADDKLILSSVKDLKKRAFTMLKKASKAQYYIFHKDDIKLL